MSRPALCDTIRMCSAVIVHRHQCENFCLVVNILQGWFGPPYRLACPCTVRYKIERWLQRKADRVLGRTTCTTAVVDKAVWLKVLTAINMMPNKKKMKNTAESFDLEHRQVQSFLTSAYQPLINDFYFRRTSESPGNWFLALRSAHSEESKTI